MADDTPRPVDIPTPPKKKSVRSLVQYITLFTAVLSLVGASIGLVKGCSTSHEVENLRTVYGSLAQTTNAHYLATTQEAEQRRHRDASQTERIRELEDQQRRLQQSLATAQNSESIRQLVLSQRKDIREAWARIELKALYNITPHSPDSTSLREIAALTDEAQYRNAVSHLSENDLVLMMEYVSFMTALATEDNYNTVHWKNNQPLERSTPLMKELFWKECRFCETLEQAKALGIISELPADLQAKFKSTLKPSPARAIYHFTGENNWWTVFEDFENFKYAVGDK